MEVYNFRESLRSSNVGSVLKKRTPNSRRAKLSFWSDNDIGKMFIRELNLMKVKFPFLTESQIQGRTLDKFCIPNIMGRPYKANKSGSVTMCTITYAMKKIKKSLSERKVGPDKFTDKVQRRHTIAGGYMPIDVIVNKIHRRINARVVKNLYNTFTLYSEEMDDDDDDYSIEASSSMDSELEDLHQGIQHQAFLDSQSMYKPPEKIKNIKTYERRKQMVSKEINVKRHHGMVNCDQSIQEAMSNNVESTGFFRKKTSQHDKKVKQLKGRKFEVSEHLGNTMSTSENNGNGIKNSDDINAVTPPKTMSISENNLDETGDSDDIIAVTPTTMPTSENHEDEIGNSDDIIAVTPIKKRRDVFSNKVLQHLNTHISECVVARNESFSSDEIHAEKTNSSMNKHAWDLSRKSIKQSISFVSNEYLESLETDGSDSNGGVINSNSNYLCGVKCISTPKLHVPLVKMNFSVWPHNREAQTSAPELNTRKQHMSNLRGKMSIHRKCSDGVIEINEVKVTAYGAPRPESEDDTDLQSDESPMSEEENTAHQTPISYRKRQLSCSSIDSNSSRDFNKFSPYIIQSNNTFHCFDFPPPQKHSSQDISSESSDEENYSEKGRMNGTDDFVVLRGRFSPQTANLHHSPTSRNFVPTPSLNALQNNDQQQQENNVPTNDGYFLANLFDDYTEQAVRRTLRSSWTQVSSSQDDDCALVVE